MQIFKLRGRRALIGLVAIGLILMATTASHGCTVSGSSPSNEAPAAGRLA